ncbi:ABC transporter permease [Oscillatoria sp. CS-180]|uniref:ABC transporter permease n=1 Tax=Oscillatoria sp. CS-180 TaxID=3021720 RepID=UPI00232EA2ED|nr:ABC transporter permease [Oscillatoria sp. CS-180]MDB9525641.1 ABC transporter permease [Oscillatoria sp. CS-180]
MIITKLLREVLAVAQRILTELLRRRRSLIFWIAFPASMLVMNSLILQERAQITAAEAYQWSAAPTLVGAALFFSCLGGSIATVVSEREQQTLKRLFLSPLSGVSYFLGIFVAHCCIGLGQALLVWAIARSVGANFSGSLILAGLVILLSIAAYVGLGFILGTQFARRTEDVNALTATFGVPLLLLGGAFLPVSLFPDTLIELAQYNPIYHMILSLEGVTTNEDGIGEVFPHLTFLTVFSGAMVLLGWWAYRQMLNKERHL